MITYIALTLVAVGAIGLDSRRLGVTHGCLEDDFVDFGRGEWFFMALFFPMLALPLYLLRRPAYKERHHRSAGSDSN